MLSVQRCLSCLVSLFCIFQINVGIAQDMSDIPAVAKSRVVPPQFEAKSWLLLDQNSGWVLARSNSERLIEPASLSKLMTAYNVFTELKKGNLTFEDKVHISNKAWKMPGSRMFVETNTDVTVDELLKGLIVQSGNDAAVALAEHIAGSEDAFAEMMTRTGIEIGLTATQYRNSTGLPDNEHLSTARDITLLTSRLIRDFPEWYAIYSIKEYTYNKITQQNRNVLLWNDSTVDGVKTGHTNSAGYCLVGSAQRDGRRLIATVIGMKSKRARADAVHALLKYGFAAYESREVLVQGQGATDIRVFKGALDSVAVGTANPLTVTVPRGGANNLKLRIQANGYLVAPVQETQTVGTLQVVLQDQVISEKPLVALKPVLTGTFVKQAMDTVKLWFK